MKKSDLYREWARVLDMCEGTNINPWQCVRQPRTKELHRTDRMPDFTMRPDDYEFAVAILEDKPVFVGDKVFDDGIATVIGLSTQYILFNDKHNCSWNPPKKTVELPCPLKDYLAFSLDLDSWGPHGRKNGKRYYFKSESDLNTVVDALHKFIQDATK